MIRHSNNQQKLSKTQLKMFRFINFLIFHSIKILYEFIGNILNEFILVLFGCYIIGLNIFNLSNDILITIIFSSTMCYFIIIFQSVNNQILRHLLKFIFYLLYSVVYNFFAITFWEIIKNIIKIYTGQIIFRIIIFILNYCDIVKINLI